MSIKPSDVLFAWDASHGIVPTVGPDVEPNIRGGDLWVANRKGGGLQRYEKRVGNQVGQTWVERDGVLVNRASLVLDRAVTPEVQSSADVDTDGSDWATSGSGVTREGVEPSVFGDDFDAIVYDDAGSSQAAQVLQTVGTFTGNPEVGHFIARRTDGQTRTDFTVRDGSAGSFVAVARFSWSGSMDMVQGDWVHWRWLDRARELVEVWIGYSATSGNTRRVRIYLTSFADTAAGKLAIHYANIYEHQAALAPVPYSGTPVTRPSQEFKFSPVGFDPEAMFVYAAFVDSGNAFGASNDRDIWRFGAGSGTNGSSFQVRGGGSSGSGTLFGQHNDADGNWHTATVSGLGNTVGRLVETYAELNPAADDLRIAARVDRGGASSGATSPGPLGDRWETDQLHWAAAFNSTPTDGALRFLRFLVVKHAAVDSALNDDVLDELQDVPIGPHRAGHG